MEQISGENKKREEELLSPQAEGEVAERFCDMFLHGGGGDSEARGDFAVLQTLVAAKREDQAASRGKLAEGRVEASAEFVVEELGLGRAAEVEVVESLVAVGGEEVVEGLLLDYAFVFQVVEASVAHHREEEGAEGEGAYLRPPFPEADEAFLHQVVGSIGRQRKAAREEAEAGRVGLEEETEGRLVSPLDAVEELGFVWVHLSA